MTTPKTRATSSASEIENEQQRRSAFKASIASRSASEIAAENERQAAFDGSAQAGATAEENREQIDLCDVNHGTNLFGAEVHQLILELNNTPTVGLNAEQTKAIINRLECIRDGAYDFGTNAASVNSLDWRRSAKNAPIPGQINRSVPHRPSLGEYDPTQPHLGTAEQRRLAGEPDQRSVLDQRRAAKPTVVT